MSLTRDLMEYQKIYPSDYSEILHLFQLGWSYRKIGDKFGVSYERIRQLLVKQFGAEGVKERVRENFRIRIKKSDSEKIVEMAKEYNEAIIKLQKRIRSLEAMNCFLRKELKKYKGEKNE